MATTRLLPYAVPGQPAGDFSGKTEQTPQRLNITRLVQFGIGWRPYADNAFAGKAEAEAEEVKRARLFMVNPGQGMNP